MEIIELRGHHLGRIARHLRDWERDDLRKTGRYDYNVYFTNTEKNYSLFMAQNDFEVSNRLFDENPLVRIIDSPDAICKACPYLVEEEGIECENPWVVSDFDGNAQERRKKLTRSIKKADVKEIKWRGFKLDDVVRFSEIFRRIINGHSTWMSFGYDDLESFRGDLDKFLHPKLIALYNQQMYMPATSV